jgi:galactonate dehydratase
MDIVDYELYEVPPRWIFLKLTTDDGTVGWGEPAFRSNAVKGAIEDLMTEHIIGHSSSEIEQRWQEMYRRQFFRGGPVLMSALAGIDIALWDIKGKELGTPVYDLLGGKVRDKVRLYQQIRRHRHESDEQLRSPEAVAEDAVEQVEKGFTALKLPPTEKLGRIDNLQTVKNISERIAEVRKAIGDEVDLCLDFHGRVSKQMADILINELEQYHPFFYEEILTPEYDDLLSNLAQKTHIPIATGERVHSRWGYRNLLSNDAVDVVQPDVSLAGGISEVNRIANMAQAYDTTIAPHCPYGPICFAASLQVDACNHNAIIQEQLIHNEYHEDEVDIDGFRILDYLSNTSTFDYDTDGYVDLPTEPGIGVDMDEDTVEEMSNIDTELEVPKWNYEDGRIAEW